MSVQRNQSLKCNVNNKFAWQILLSKNLKGLNYPHYMG